MKFDVASLMRDALPELGRSRRSSIGYVTGIRRAQRPVLPVRRPLSSITHSKWMGLQRHPKVLGIFARINYRDGKPHHLADTPRFVNYTVRHRGELVDRRSLRSVLLFDGSKVPPRRWAGYILSASHGALDAMILVAGRGERVAADRSPAEAAD